MAAPPALRRRSPARFESGPQVSRASCDTKQAAAVAAAYLLQPLQLAVEAGDGGGLLGVGTRAEHGVHDGRGVHVGAAHGELQRRLALAQVVGVRIHARQEVRARVAGQGVLQQGGACQQRARPAVSCGSPASRSSIT